MNQRDIFRHAYSLFQDIEREATDADIIMVLTGALATSFSQGYEEGRRAEAEQQAAAEAAEFNAMFRDACEALTARDNEFAVCSPEFRDELDSFFSDDVDHYSDDAYTYGSDLTLDEVEEARGPVGNAYEFSEGHDFTFTVDAAGNTSASMRLVPRFPGASFSHSGV